MSKVATLICGVLVAAGCGGGGIAANDLPGEFEGLVCQIEVECGGYPDMDSCRQAAFVPEGLDQLLAGVEDGRIEFDSDAAQRCIDFMEDHGGCDIVGGATGEELDAACDGVFGGLVAVGGECYADEECAGDAACDLPCSSTECCAGTCVAVDPEPDPVGIGVDCTDAPCVAGAYCSADDLCVAVGGDGDPCPGFGIEYCENGLFCDAFLSDSTCYRPAGQGETCDPARGLGMFACIRSDNWCDPADNTCKKLALPGEDCDGELGNCVDYAYCASDTSKCVASPGLSDPCGGTQEIGCLGDLLCVDSVCVAPEPTPICGPDSPA